MTAEVHDRLPVILAAEDETRWIEGPPPEALGLCRPWTGAIAIERMNQSWARRI